MLASRFGKVEQLTKRSLMGRFGTWFEKIYTTATNDYLRLLRLSLASPGKVLLIAALVFVLALSLVFFNFIGSEFMPQADQSQLSVSIQLNTGAKIEQTDAITQNVEQIIERIPEVQTVYTNVGSGGGWGGSATGYESSMTVVLVPKNKRSRSAGQIGGMLRGQLRQIPGVKAFVSEPSVIPGSGGQAPIQVAINGPNWDDVSQTADQVSKIIARIPGTADVRLSVDDPQPERSIQVDRDKMASMGLDMAGVGQTLQLALTGNTDSKFLDRDGDQYDINVMLDQADRVHTSEVGNFNVANRTGQLVPLNQFANIVSSMGPTELQRRNRSYSITVNSQAVGRTSGDIGNDVKAALDQEKFPSGVNTTFVGTLQSQADSFFSLGLSLLAAIVFVYLIMSALYNSFIYPLTVLFSVPLGVTGALLALALTKNSLAVFSIMGIIMQVGLVSKNAILLVDFTNKGREEGLSVKEALIEAGRERLRPILMTSLTMVFGMLPLALSKASSAEFKNSMGWALIGGLICSMLMTLVVVPVAYTQIERFRSLITDMGERFTSKHRTI
jgi:HAE1 family hydrophobic/amphiphilic exporter-1